jgi:hypothetical protein
MIRYLWIYLGTTFGVLAAIVAFNVVTDPYRLFFTGPWPWLNALKPHASDKQGLGKALLAETKPGDILVLGNSRAEVGFDPESAAWPEKTVLNLALAGTRLDTARNYLKHAAAFRKPKLVLLGVDFTDFLVGPDDIAKQSSTPSEAPPGYILSVLPDGRPYPGYGYRIFLERVLGSISLQTFWNSLGTVAAQKSPYAEDLTDKGFNPLREYNKITATEGYYSIFKQKALDSAKTLAKRPKSIVARDGHSSKVFEAYADVLSYAKAQDISLIVLIYPYHADYLEMLRLAGHESNFEEWKRHLVTLTERGSGGHAILWDFSGYNDYTTEAVPPPKDRKTTVRWYWEAGHFKKELGEKLLARIFAPEIEGGETANGFGVLLDSRNLESHLERLRQERTEYISKHPEAVERLESWLSGTF